MNAFRMALFAAFAMVPTGCETPPPEEPPGFAFVIGSHNVRVRIPTGWEVLDQGRQVLVRKGSAVIVMQDLGPVGPPVIRSEIDRLQELWRSGQADQARWQMREISIPDDSFSTPSQAVIFREAWNRVLNATMETPYPEIDLAFAEIRASVQAMPQRDLRRLTDEALATLGHNERREVRSRIPGKTGGREGLDVQTWDRLTHASPYRLLFVLNGSDLFVLRIENADDTETVAVFESIQATIQFVPGRVPEGTRR